MKKDKAIELLGGTVTCAATEIGINPQAVTQWPDDLPPRLSDRVLAAWARKNLAKQIAKAAPELMQAAHERPHAMRDGV